MTLLLSLRPAYSASSQFITLIVPGLNASDFVTPELSEVRALISEGSCGWMVCRSAFKVSNNRSEGSGNEAMLAEALTLGSGARATFPMLRFPPQNLMSTGSASVAAYKADISSINAVNSVLDHPVIPGLLGSMMHSAGLKTAVISDGENSETNSSADMMVMDPSGEVDFMNPSGRVFRKDPKFPFGICTDLLKISESLHQVENSASLITVQFSDLERAKVYAKYSMPGIDKIHLQRALSELNILLRFLRVYVLARQNCRLMIIGMASEDSGNTSENRLQPAILFGDGVSPGTLYSASTRRNGIVLDVDYLPTASSYLHLDTRRTHYGRPIQFKPRLQSTDPLQSFIDMYKNLIRSADIQNKLGGLPTIQMLLVIAGVLAILFRRKVCWVRSSGIVIAALPLGMLILPPLSGGSYSVSAVMLLVFVTICAVIGWDSSLEGKRSRRALESICLSFLLIVLGDLLTGSRLIMQAWMSYSVVEAARFYGIGNEYMGVVIGAGCVLIASRWKNRPLEKGLSSGSEFGLSTDKKELILRFGICFLLGLLVLVIGAPQFGAKVGAVPTAIIGFGAALALANYGRVDKISAAMMIGAIILVFALNFAVDLSYSAAGQSHFIRAIHGVGVESFWSIGIRKISLEVRLLVTSPWSLTMTVAASAFHWQCISIRNRSTKLLDNRILASGIWISAAAALLLNDSGVTAAALIFLFGWASLAASYQVIDFQ